MYANQLGKESNGVLINDSTVKVLANSIFKSINKENNEYDTTEAAVRKDSKILIFGRISERLLDFYGIGRIDRQFQMVKGDGDGDGCASEKVILNYVTIAVTSYLSKILEILIACYYYYKT